VTVPRPPRVARFLVTSLAPEAVREFLVGDLDEQFADTARRLGRAAAWRRYWRQALRAGWEALAIRADERRRARVLRLQQTPTRRFQMARLWRDLRLGVRAAWRAPGYSAITIVTLALAIGANTLLFSIANPLVARPLPIDRPETLAWFIGSQPEREIVRSPSSLPDFLEWRAQLKSVSALAGYEIRQDTLTGLGDARRVTTCRATANLPEVWGLVPFQGRFFHAGDDTPGRDLTGVLSYRFWQEAFQGDRGVIGRTFTLDGKTLTIVGIMPASIEIGNLALIDIWAPLPLDPNAARDRRVVRVIGRLAPGATLAQAEAELQPIVAQQTRDHLTTHQGWQVHVRPTKEALAAEDTWVLLGLLGVVVVFILLIACANLSNLTLARLVSRRQEFALQLALGASRWQLVRPLLAESAVLSVIGGAAGLALAYGGVRLMAVLSTEPFLRQLAIDRNVLTFTALLSLATPFLFTLWPALTAGRSAAREMSYGGRASAGRETGRRRNVLVAAQVALALSLLVVSALVVQSMLWLRRVDLGFDPRPLLTWRLDLPEARYPDDVARARFIADAERRLAALPGVTHAALMTHLPVLEGDSPRPLTGTRHDGEREEERAWASWFAVTPDFFRAANITTLAGRTFAPSDTAGDDATAVVNRLAAERYFDRLDDALGRRIVIHDSVRGPRTVTIVGVVSDTRDAQVTRSSPQIYVPFGQWPATGIRGLVSAADPEARAPDVQSLMRQLDPEVPISDLKRVTTMVEDEAAGTHVIEFLFVAFAGLALALAASGLFGVVSYSVGQRRREIGIRLALGASPGAIARMVMAGGFKVVGVGMLAGLLLAMLLARASASLLYGITAGDPATFAGVTAIILLVTATATWNPAARAMRVDPAKTLRAE
jgi:putative ABC transport system permease protein